MDELVRHPTWQRPTGAVRRHNTPLIATLTAKRPPEGNHRESWYLYDVDFNGEIVVADSKDAECELARALQARGITGSVTLLDANTGKPRITINIEKAAKLTVQETRSHGPRFVKWRPIHSGLCNDKRTTQTISPP